MNCDEMVELISAHIDGELSPAEQQVLEQHLNQCSQCSSLQQRLLHMEKGFAQIPQQAAPRLRRVTARRSPWAWWGLAAAAAALLLLVWRIQPRADHALYFAAGKLAPLASAQQPGRVVPFSSGPLYAKMGESGAVTRFRLHLDSDSQPCSNLQLELSYDFEGDHNIDRKEVYKPFSTDGQDGWQEFSEEIGLLEATGEMRDFEGGQIYATIWNAPAHLQILEGKSHLIPPHTLTAARQAGRNYKRNLASVCTKSTRGI